MPLPSHYLLFYPYHKYLVNSIRHVSFHKALVLKQYRPEEKRPLGVTKCRWGNNTKMDLQEVGCGGKNWIELALDRDRWRELVNAGMNFWVP
jgi:hypothetical protein